MSNNNNSSNNSLNNSSNNSLNNSLNNLEQSFSKLTTNDISSDNTMIYEKQLYDKMLHYLEHDKKLPPAQLKQIKDEWYNILFIRSQTSNKK